MSARPPVTCVAPPVVMPERQIELSWDDGRNSRYHFVWLRQQHFLPATGRPDQQSGDPFRLPDEPASLRVRNAVIDDDMLAVVWDNDGAETRHQLSWLRANAYDRELRRARKLRPIPWVAGSGPPVHVA